LIGHGKINACKITSVKKYATQRHIINFGFLKITIKEIAIDEGYCLEGTLSKITIIEVAIFKIFVFGIGIV
jgi:hypothetical protein